jgi:hypothetical protein
LRAFHDRHLTLCERFLRSQVYPAKSGSGGDT